MGTGDIRFHEEIRKISMLFYFWLKQTPYLELFPGTVEPQRLKQSL